ncbi:hypothetical protein D3C84_975090 [compost metagenome]
MQTAQCHIADLVSTVVLLVVGLGNVVAVVHQGLSVGRVCADPQPRGFQLPGGGREVQVVGQGGLAIHVVDLLLHDVIERVLAHQ